MNLPIQNDKRDVFLLPYMGRTFDDACVWNFVQITMKQVKIGGYIKFVFVVVIICLELQKIDYLACLTQQNLTLKDGFPGTNKVALSKEFLACLEKFY